jgi:hypothetical protein
MTFNFDTVLFLRSCSGTCESVAFKQEINPIATISATSCLVDFYTSNPTDLGTTQSLIFTESKKCTSDGTYEELDVTMVLTITENSATF